VQRGLISDKSVASHLLNNDGLYCYPPIRRTHSNQSLFTRTIGGTSLNGNQSLNISTF